jgi:hypothetical protein
LLLDFVANVLVDKSDDGSILPDKCDELIAMLETAQQAGGSAAKKKKKSADDDDDTSSSPLQKIKAAYEAQQADVAAGQEPPSKKKKQQAVELYAEYHKCKVDDLKDILRWNGQTLTGTKEILLFKVSEECVMFIAIYTGGGRTSPLTGDTHTYLTTCFAATTINRLLTARNTDDWRPARSMERGSSSMPTVRP